MTFDLRRALLAGFLGMTLALASCGGDDDENQPGGNPGTTGCVEDEDCPDVNLFYCDQARSECVPSCRTKEDCSADNRGEHALDFCAGALGCQCDVTERGGQCVAALCSADADCGASNVCRNGKCEAAPAATQVNNCQLTPDYVIARVGTKVRFTVATWTGTTPVVVKEGVAWSSTAATVAVSGAPTGTVAEFDVSTAGAEAAAVQAKVGQATCTAKVLALAPPPADTLRVTVTDELTGRPISGARVLVTRTSDVSASGIVGAVQQTSAEGTASVSVAGVAQAVTVSVFHNSFNYLTVVGYNPAAGGASRDLAVALRRNQVDNYGGFKGTYTGIPTGSVIHAAIGGMSIAGSVTDLSPTQLLGRTVPTDIAIGDAVKQDDVPLPAGTYLKYGTSDIKTQIEGQGLAGVCTSAVSQDPEAAIRSGQCGTRTAWSFTASVPLSELPLSAFAGGVDNLDIGGLLEQVSPILRRFSSTVTRDVEFTLKPTPGANDGAPSFEDTSHFTTRDQEFGQVPLGFGFSVQVPSLPQLGGQYVDGVVAIGGAFVPGRGVVPLGLGAGFNADDNQSTDPQGESDTANVIDVRMAPTHHGLEGSEYGLIAAAASMDALTNPSVGLAMSAVYHRFTNNQLKFDPRGSQPISIAGPFPTLPENARYDFGTRTFSFTSVPNLSGMSLVRVTFRDRFEHRWTVVMDAAAAASGFKLPRPSDFAELTAGAIADRTYFENNPSLSRSELLVQTLKLAKSGGTAVGFNALWEQDDANADRITELTQSFAVLDYARPTVSWLNPAPAPTKPTVTVGSTLTVDVGYFKVGPSGSGDGGVRFSFAGGSGSCAAQTVTTYANAEAGEVTLAMPDCRGATVSLVAQLVDTSGTPVSPPVAASLDVTVP